MAPPIAFTWSKSLGMAIWPLPFSCSRFVSPYSFSPTLCSTHITISLTISLAESEHTWVGYSSAQNVFLVLHLMNISFQRISLSTRAHGQKLFLTHSGLNSVFIAIFMPIFTSSSPSVGPPRIQSALPVFVSPTRWWHFWGLDLVLIISACVQPSIMGCRAEP